VRSFPHRQSLYSYYNRIRSIRKKRFAFPSNHLGRVPLLVTHLHFDTLPRNAQPFVFRGRNGSRPVSKWNRQAEARTTLLSRSNNPTIPQKAFRNVEKNRPPGPNIGSRNRAHAFHEVG
jgi:hypothetical protein